MTVRSLDLPGFNWIGLSSIGRFLSLRELANLSATRRIWRYFLDHPCMRRIVQERLQREWWVTCSVTQMQMGFQNIRKQIDFSMRFPYKFTKFPQKLLDPSIRSSYLGDRHWISVDWKGQMRFAEKYKSATQVGIHSPVSTESPVCIIGGNRCVIVAQRNTYCLNMALKTITEVPIPPNYSVFRWSENEVIFASHVGSNTALSLYVFGDTKIRCKEKGLFYSNTVHQVMPCSEQLGIIGTTRNVYAWKKGQNGSCTSLKSSGINTFWNILPLSQEKIALREGLELAVGVWNIEQCRKERDYIYSTQLEMAKMPNQSFLMYSQNESQALFIDPLMPKPIFSLTSPAKGFTGAVWTGKGPYLVTSYDKNIHFWDMRRYQMIQSMYFTKAMNVFGKMTSGDLFLKDPLNRFVALLSPSSKDKSTWGQTI